VPNNKSDRLSAAIEVIQAHDDALSELTDHVEVQSRLILALFQALDRISNAKTDE
jgi:hypothetical protein